jgi:ubiquinone/menaquinone biosynthesis C-methylase UbiE
MKGSVLMEEKECTIEDCDIFDFMARHVGMTVIHPGGFKATHRLSEALRIDKNAKVVDIACGKGTTSVFLAQKYDCQVVGIDISGDLIAEAEALKKRKGLEGKVSFFVGDALDMPFSDNEFDVAISQAMLILVSDKELAVKEALRVTKSGGRAGWLELSWKKQTTKEFIDAVSNVLCAYCMLKVHTYEDWEKLFKKAGVKHLEIIASSMEFGGLRGMFGDEGFYNAFKIMYRFLTKSRIRRRMSTMNKFFKENGEYFGFGIYIGEK